MLAITCIGAGANCKPKKEPLSKFRVGEAVFFREAYEYVGTVYVGIPAGSRGNIQKIEFSESGQPIYTIEPELRTLTETTKKIQFDEHDLTANIDDVNLWTKVTPYEIMPALAPYEYSRNNDCHSYMKLSEDGTFSALELLGSEVVNCQKSVGFWQIASGELCFDSIKCWPLPEGISHLLAKKSAVENNDCLYGAANLKRFKGGTFHTPQNGKLRIYLGRDKTVHAEPDSEIFFGQVFGNWDVKENQITGSLTVSFHPNDFDKICQTEVSTTLLAACKLSLKAGYEQVADPDVIHRAKMDMAISVEGNNKFHLKFSKLEFVPGEAIYPEKKSFHSTCSRVPRK